MIRKLGDRNVELYKFTAEDLGFDLLRIYIPHIVYLQMI